MCVVVNQLGITCNNVKYFNSNENLSNHKFFCKIVFDRQMKKRNQRKRKVAYSVAAVSSVDQVDKVQKYLQRIFSWEKEIEWN